MGPKLGYTGIYAQGKDKGGTQTPDVPLLTLNSEGKARDVLEGRKPKGNKYSLIDHLEKIRRPL